MTDAEFMAFFRMSAPGWLLNRDDWGLLRERGVITDQGEIDRERYREMFNEAINDGRM